MYTGILEIRIHIVLNKRGMFVQASMWQSDRQTDRQTPTVRRRTRQACDA